MTVYDFGRYKGISASGCLITAFTTQQESTPCVKRGPVVDADGCGQEGSPVALRLTADLKKPLTEDTLLL
ncbi:hypothetical protein CHARACLAT_016162 [Characodon lateralis]|uniref:Uncharacterized protein n=1 Tax=Characodon lateralis TaxID=208331 RepID=A0ABU7EDB3_9TELE|nr:hypothetical protein [Characodon lateralis]